MLKAVERTYDKPLRWDSVDFINEFNDLEKHPPLHSVVIHIEPVVAKQLLKTTNTRNRPLMQSYATRLSQAMTTEDYEITGDTLKFSKKGLILDGQHRLRGCEQQSTPIISHVVFGLADEIFDVIDQGKKRTPGDVLALCGVKDYTTVAGAVRWVLTLEKGHRSIANSRGMTSRRIREQALGSMRDIARYTKLAKLISKAFKQPPTLIAALLFMISRHDHALTERFADDWLHGNRNYHRNTNFDLLLQRITTIRNQQRGHLNRIMLAALLVQVFNHWNADIAAPLRSLTWDKKFAFPRLEFDKAEFLKQKDQGHWSNSSLQASQQRIMMAMHEQGKGTGKVTMPIPVLAKASNVPERQCNYVLKTLIASGAIYLDKKGTGGKPSTYRLALVDKPNASAKSLVTAK